MPASPRRKEILAWLAKHPKVTRYVVIDDEDDELDRLPLFRPSARTRNEAAANMIFKDDENGQ